MQHGYLELKLAHELFKKAPDTLNEAEQARLGEIAGKQARLEQRILSSAAAARASRNSRARAIPSATIADPSSFTATVRCSRSSNAR